MRLSPRAMLACLGAVAALLAGPAVAASASTTAQAAPHVTVLPGRGGVTLTSPTARGTHAISQTIRVISRTGTAAGSIPDWKTTTAVSVRVGKNNCAGFKGDVEWGGTTSGVVDYMDVYGDLWNNCNAYTSSTVYLYFGWQSYYPDGTKYNDLIGSVYSGTVRINVTYPPGPGNKYPDVTYARPLSIDTCLQWNQGWGCGQAQYV